jgi:hypothetical protein
MEAKFSSETSIHFQQTLNYLHGETNCASIQELTKILWNPKVHYRVHKSPPLVPILIHINPVHTTPSYLSKIYFNIVHPTTSWSSTWSLSFWLSHQYPICIPLRPHSCYMPCPYHHPLLDHSNYTWRRVQAEPLPRNGPGISAHFTFIAWQRLYTLQYEPKFVVKRVDAHIQNVLCSGCQSSYDVQCFPLSLQTDAEILRQIRRRPLRSTPF